MITPAAGAMTTILDFPLADQELCACTLSGNDTAQCILVQLECETAHITLTPT